MKTSKDKLRKVFKEKRAHITPARRQQAEELLLIKLYPKLLPYDKVLSFASFKDEINLWPLNQKLLEENRLLLPRIEGLSIQIYEVACLEDLLLSPQGFLEPHPKKCLLYTTLGKNFCALIPGLAFDAGNHRLGYGQGHFDRWLSQNNPKRTFGIGYREQWTEESFPISEQDKSLDEVILF